MDNSFLEDSKKGGIFSEVLKKIGEIEEWIRKHMASGGHAFVETGTYTPILANITNIAASVAYLCQYYRIGNMVTVSGRVDIDPTAVGVVLLSMSVPINSAFTDGLQCGGAAVSQTLANSCALFSNGANTVYARGYATSAANSAFNFSFTYQIL